MANIEEKVENLISKKIIDLGYELYDVQYTKEGSDYYLKIFIEKNRLMFYTPDDSSLFREVFFQKYHTF